MPIIPKRKFYETFTLDCKKEQRSKQQLLENIFSQYQHLPNKQFLKTYLEILLEKKSSFQIRLQTLKDFRKHPQIFINSAQHAYFDVELLSNLGLRWNI